MVICEHILSGASDDYGHGAEDDHRERQAERLTEYLITLTAAESCEIWYIQGERRPEPDGA